MFKLTIKTDKQAFEQDARGEIARILEDICEDIYRGREPSVVYDINGNKVGKIEWGV